MPVLSM